jgi:RNA polymerase sigma factor (sigma-70 family)
MKPEEPRQSFDSILTPWTVFGKAHAGSAKSISAAQGELLQRYSRAIHRYLLGALHDREAADELGQEFALRFIRGDCAGADPERGRFRDFVKGVLSHLIADFYRKRGRSPNLPDRLPEPAAPDPSSDKEFLKSWRDELLQHAWDELAGVQARTKKLFHTVLRFRTDHPKLKSEQLAKQLSAQLGFEVTATWVRQTLHRARQQFIHLLLHAVLETMSQPTMDDLEAELSELGLMKYCGPALQRLRGEK